VTITKQELEPAIIDAANKLWGWKPGKSK
jgi:hypothetical protein